jgi:hypothetical protein
MQVISRLASKVSQLTFYMIEKEVAFYQAGLD